MVSVDETAHTRYKVAAVNCCWEPGQGGGGERGGDGKPGEGGELGGIVHLGGMFCFVSSYRFLCGVSCVVFVQYCFVVACYYLLHVGHAAAAKCYCVSIQ